MATISTSVAGNQNTPLYLDLISFSEGTSTSRLTKNGGYDVIVTGVDGPEVFLDYSTHPFAARAAKLIVAPGNRFPDGLYSSASGRYQIIVGTWRAYCKRLGLSDFTPLTQDLIAIAIIKDAHALAAISNGDIPGACALLHEQWASLPGSTAGQGGKTMDALLTQWHTLHPPVPVDA